MTTGQAQPLIAQQADHLAGGSLRKKCLEDQGNRMLHRPVGIFDDPAIRLAQQPGWEGEGSFASLRLLLHARKQAAAQGMQLDFAHDALHPEQ